MTDASGSTSLTVEQAHDLCRRMAHQHGANFSVGFRFLPPEKRRAVYAAYAFCRFADDIVDEPGENIPHRLDEWQRELGRCYAQEPTHPITVALADSLRHFEIPQNAFLALIDGCRQDMVKTRYETFEELRHYCDLVATSISDVSLSIFGHRTEAAKVYGGNLATALQLTNVTRDIGDDMQRDRIYIPREELERFGVTEEMVRLGEKGEATRRLIGFQVERARDFFRQAEPLIQELAFDARFPVLLMGGIYSDVLDEISRDLFAPLERRVRLPLHRKIGTVLSRLLRPRFTR